MAAMQAMRRVEKLLTEMLSIQRVAIVVLCALLAVLVTTGNLTIGTPANTSSHPEPTPAAGTENPTLRVGLEDPSSAG
jgi:hypothetical protein